MLNDDGIVVAGNELYACHNAFMYSPYSSRLFRTDMDAIVGNTDGFDGRMLLFAKTPGNKTAFYGPGQAAFVAPEIKTLVVPSVASRFVAVAGALLILDAAGFSAVLPVGLEVFRPPEQEA